MWCGINRITTSGRVAGEAQKISREGALRAVTLDAAYSLKMEKEIGSIVTGKLANFTILGDSPVTCDPHGGQGCFRMGHRTRRTPFSG